MNKLSSPYLVLHLDKNEIGVFNSIDVFKKTSREILNSGYFNRLRIFTKEGLTLKLINAKEIGYNGIIRGWNPMLKGICIKIDYEFEPAKIIEFNELKEMVNKRLRTPSFNSIINIEEIKLGVNEASNYSEIILALESIN
jgi:hypothetical protein